MITICHGDCLEVLPTLPDDSVDAIVTDPPYGLSFMGKGWDHSVPGVDYWRECLRVAKPGAHLLAFGGTRTFHRLTCAIEDAGWQIRDCIMWLYGSGFPKSHDVSNAIDKAAGAEREVIGLRVFADGTNGRRTGGDFNGVPSDSIERTHITAPATPEAQQWSGWGTALKPAWEPIIVARKPLIGTVAENVLKYGTGGINVDGCRVECDSRPHRKRMNDKSLDGDVYGSGINGSRAIGETSVGRWPANLIHDGSEEVTEGFPGQEDKSASRFFYCAKASRADRDGSTHPTMKPTALMRYLCRLVTPPGGVVLDPFCGSGSTGKGAILEGFQFIGIDIDADSVEIARARTAWAVEQMTRLF